MQRFIVEGLDGVGKTFIAKYLHQHLSLDYYKIKKTVKPSGLEEDITQCIVNEMSDKLGFGWSGVLDRGFYSTVGTGLCFDAGMNPYKVYVPRNLVGTTNVLVTSKSDVVLARCNRLLSAQDRCVLEGGLFNYAQDWMVNNVPRGYVLIENNFTNLGLLLDRLDDVVKNSFRGK